MSAYTLRLRTTAAETRVLLQDGRDEMLRAVLPPPKQVRNLRAAATLLEGLALWLDQPLRVVVSAEALDAMLSLGLTDDLGYSRHSLFYKVDVVEPRRPRRARTLGGLGRFDDLRRLRLINGERA